MAGGLFNRLKIWAFEEVLKSKDLNAEFDNIINHMSPAFIASFSLTISQMQTQLDPGDVGSEVLAQSLAQEIEQLRFVISRIVGLNFFYQPPAISLEETNLLINQIAGLPPNRIVSGNEISATDEMPSYLVPNGATNSLTVDATPTPLVFRINGTQYTLTTDVVLTGLVMPPTTNNTALVNDATLIGDIFSTVKGEFGSTITIDAVGTEISNLVGKYAGFKVVDGGNTEYFTAFVKSATELVSLRRGFFFDSTLSPLNRIAINDNDVITLMKLTFFFIKTDFSVEAVYTNPTYSAATPASPAVGDYWFNVTTNIWNRFNGSAWLQADATLLGIALTDSTATVAARSQDFFANVTNVISMEIDYVSNTQVHGTQQQAEVNVMGRVQSFGHDDLIWDITTDLESGFSEAASTMYFLYITEQGAKKISPNYPQLRQDFEGTFYHPYKQWRCVGMAYNNSGSNLESASGLSLHDSGTLFVTNGNGHGLSSLAIRRYTTVQSLTPLIIFTDDVNLGSLFTAYWPLRIVCNAIDTRAAAAWNSSITKNTPAALLSTDPGVSTLYPYELAFVQTTTATTTIAWATSDFSHIGDIYRVQDNGTPDGTSFFDSHVKFNVTPHA